MNILFETLKHQHKEILGSLEVLLHSVHVEDRKTNLQNFRKSILSHMIGEEQIVYPAVAENKENKQDAFEAVEEHHVAQMVLNELMTLSPEHERFHPKTRVLKELISHHIEEEEDIFEDLKETFSDEQLNGIEEKYRDVYESTYKELNKKR